MAPDGACGVAQSTARSNAKFEAEHKTSTKPRNRQRPTATSTKPAQNSETGRDQQRPAQNSETGRDQERDQHKTSTKQRNRQRPPETRPPTPRTSNFSWLYNSICVP